MQNIHEDGFITAMLFRLKRLRESIAATDQHEKTQHEEPVILYVKSRPNRSTKIIFEGTGNEL